MNIFLNTMQLLLWALAFAVVNYSVAGDDHAAHHEEHEQKGPNGGKLLHEGELNIEILMFEGGLAPQMRAFLYQDGKLLDPKAAELEVQLHRIDGQRDRISFTAAGDFLRGEQSISEPHSYDVDVSLSLGAKQYHWHYESHEGRSVIDDAMLAASAIETEIAGAKTLNIRRQLFAVIAAPMQSQAGIYAPYPSVVEKLHAASGQQVKRAEKIATLRNIKTLQTYTLKSPIDGELGDWQVTLGQRVEQQALNQVMDLSKVWVEMSAFPEDIEKLAVGQSVTVEDMHQHERAMGEIIYIAPQMTGGHIARARALIANPDGHWRPGMHVKANILTAKREVELAVRNEALQSFREFTVVFARFANQFEVRMLELGESDGQYTEVLSGLKPNTEYATKNSFIIKADVLKAGVAHDH